MYLFVNGGTAMHLLGSPQEGQLLLDVLRNEKSVYDDDTHGLVMRVAAITIYSPTWCSTSSLRPLGSSRVAASRPLTPPQRKRLGLRRLSASQDPHLRPISGVDTHSQS